MATFPNQPMQSMFMKAEHRQWLYSKDCPQGRIFEEGDEIPTGFVDSPDKVNVAPKKKAKKKAK